MQDEQLQTTRQADPFETLREQELDKTIFAGSMFSFWLLSSGTSVIVVRRGVALEPCTGSRPW